MKVVKRLVLTFAIVLLCGCSIEGKKEIISFNIYSTEDEQCYGEICVNITKLSDEECVSPNNMNCNSVDVTVKAGEEGKESKEYTISTDGKYTQIDGTKTYLFAKIDNGGLIVGLAE